MIYVVLAVGDYTGLSDHLIAVPFRSLKLDDRSGNIVLSGTSRAAIDRAERKDSGRECQGVQRIDFAQVENDDPSGIRQAARSSRPGGSGPRCRGARRPPEAIS